MNLAPTSALFRPGLSVLGIATLLALACGGEVPLGTSGLVTPANTAPKAASAEPTEAKYAATEVLVSWAGAAGAPPTVTRTEAEAHALAQDLWRKVLAGEDLDALAKAHSDGPAAPRGGRIGVYRTGTMVPAFERAVAAIPVGQLTAPFSTPFGWHVVRRDAVVEIAARHVMVSWKGAWRSASTRSKDEARARVETALKRLEAGEDFLVVAKELSDDPTARSGGDLGPIAPGQFVPAFEDAAFALAVGQRSTVVETPYGFHVIERTK